MTTQEALAALQAADPTRTYTVQEETVQPPNEERYYRYWLFAQPGLDRKEVSHTRSSTLDRAVASMIGLIRQEQLKYAHTSLAA
jgi:hypothetical protein